MFFIFPGRTVGKLTQILIAFTLSQMKNSMLTFTAKIGIAFAIFWKVNIVKRQYKQYLQIT